MSFVELANTVKSWIHQFWQDERSNKIRTYDEIPDELWQFIWICISYLKHESIVLRSLEKLPCGKSFTWGGDIDVLGEGVDLDWVKAEIVRIINKFETPFTIYVDPFPSFNYFAPNTQQLTIKTVCPGRVQEYGVFLKCLFDITTSCLYTAGNGREMSSLRYTKKRKPVEAFAYWFMSSEKYQQCLQLFPRWPLKMSLEWHRETRKLCDVYLIPDLVSICLGFL